MTVEYGYLGSIDVASKNRQVTLQPTGEPTHTPTLGNRWSKELLSSDNKYRILTGGSAGGRGIDNVFDSILADNCTIIVLCRAKSRHTSWLDVLSKLQAGSTPGFAIKRAPTSDSSGSHIRIDNTTTTATSYYCAGSNTVKDHQWYWHAVSLSGLNLKQYLNNNISTHTRLAGSLLNNISFVINSNSGLIQHAATLIYNRVLTDTEVINITLGKKLPLEVSGCVGYYKFNESHNNSTGQCTDYSGAGNHLTYSGATWETDIPTGTELWEFGNQTATNVTQWASLTSAPLMHPGSRYKLTFNLSGIDSGEYIYVYAGGLNQPITSQLNSNGYYEVEFECRKKTSTTVSFTAESPGNSSWVVSNISLKETIRGGGQLSFPYMQRPKLDRSLWWNSIPAAIPNYNSQGSIFANSQTISVAHDNRLSLLNTVAISGWFRFIKAQDNQWYLIDKDSGSPNWYAAPYAVLYSEQGAPKLIFQRGSSTGYTQSFIVLNKPIPHDTWVHIVAIDETNPNSSGTSTFYINGINVGQASRPAATIADSGGPLALSTAGSRKMYIRSLRLFSRTITPTEVGQLFLTDTITNRTGLVGEWLMNTPDNAVIYDTSGNNLNASVGTNMVTLDSPYQVPRKKRFGKQFLPGRLANTTANIAVPTIKGSRYITVSAWIKPKGPFVTSSFRIGILTSLANAAMFIAGSSSEYIAVYARSNQSESVVNAIRSTPVLKWRRNEWQLVSAEVDYTNKTIKVYINGILVQIFSNLAFANNTYTDTGNPSINFGNLGTETCVLDDVRIYSGSLSPSEHYNIYLNNPTRTGLVAEYLFDRRNLLKYTENFELWQVTAATASGKTVTFNNTEATNSNINNIINFLPSSTLTVKCNISCQTTGTIRLRISNGVDQINGDPSFTVGPTPTTCLHTFVFNNTTPNNAYFRVFTTDTNMVNKQITISNLQLELGPVPSIYEPILDNGNYCQDTSGNNYHATWSNMDMRNYVQEL